MVLAGIVLVSAFFLAKNNDMLLSGFRFFKFNGKNNEKNYSNDRTFNRNASFC